MKGFFSLLFFLMYMTAVSAGEDSFESMVQTELDFSGMAAEQGAQAAFLHHLADSSVLFTPRPVNAKAWLVEHPMSPGVLSWRPTVAGISHTGDLGFSTGPWQYRKTKDSDPVATGTFLTIWKKQTDGSWKAVLDSGVDVSSHDVTVLEVKRLPGAQGNDNGERKSRHDALLEADRQAWTTFEAFRKSLHADPILLRQAPVEGESEKHLTSDGAEVSAGGDFGYTYGTFESSDRTTGTYVRVWQYDEGWKIAVDLRKPDPQKPKS